MTKKDKLSLIFNCIIFAVTVFACVITFCDILFIEVPVLEHGIKIMKFFTMQSNVLAGIVALLYVIFYVLRSKKGKKFPTILYVLKYIATIDLIITFLVVTLFLGFIVEEGYFTLFVNGNFFFHFFTPVINAVSFICFEEFYLKEFKYTFTGIIHMVLYSIFYMSVVLTHMVDGVVDLKYDWYAFAQKGLPLAFAIALGLLVITYFVGFALWKIKNKQNQKLKESNE